MSNTSPSSWQQLVIETQGENAEALCEQLSECGALSVTLVDLQDEPLFQQALNETPLWQQTGIKALFSETADLATLVAQLDKPQHFQYRIEHLKEQDWVHQTQQHFPPQCFAEKLWVFPSWHEELKPEPYLNIDPGLAFGTGSHPTTALCLTWLAEHPPIDLSIIDYGCGSGILSLAALALGAQSVWAVDHDPQALTATHNNANLNEMIQPEQLHIVSPETLPKQKADLIIANILANPLIELAPTLMNHAADHTTLLLSGLLNTETDRVLNAYAPHFTLAEAREQENWMCLVLARKY